MVPTASILITNESGAVILRARGSWLAATVGGLERRMRALRRLRARQVRLDLAGIDRLDTAGAWLLLRTEQELRDRDNTVEVADQGRFAQLLDRERKRGGVSPPPRPRHVPADLAVGVGEWFEGAVRRVGSMIAFGGLVSITALQLMRRPRELAAATPVQMEQAGLKAMPIIGTLSMLMGIVMAYLAANQLRQFGAEIYTVNLLGIAVLRDLRQVQR
ncbi:MAG TPA: ABC transporter permease [Stellaceae bacterium]|nr:ABC transporter permease [Stellaceae bacterium]